MIGLSSSESSVKGEGKRKLEVSKVYLIPSLW